MLLLAVVIAVINTIVLIINPQQLDSVIDEQVAHSFLSHSEGYISNSSSTEITTPDQNIPLYEFKNEAKVLVQPAPRYLQLYQSINPVETSVVSKSASGYLNSGAKPKLNGVELFILHRRLNT